MTNPGVGKCGHPQDPDRHLSGPWLEDLPCAWPNCSSGYEGSLFKVALPMMPMFDHGTELTYVRETTGSFFRAKHHRWMVQR